MPHWRVSLRVQGLGYSKYILPPVPPPPHHIFHHPIYSSSFCTSFSFSVIYVHVRTLTYLNCTISYWPSATPFSTGTFIMKSTKVQTLGGIWWKYWNIWIENTFACIRIIVLGIYRTSFQHNLHCFINACVHVVND